MNDNEEADKLERLIYGFDYGSKRFELLRLCFPWMKRVSITGSSDSGEMKCLVECKSGCSANVAEGNALGAVLSYLTCYTLSFEAIDGHGGWGGLTLTYKMKKGHPWIEAGPDDNVYIPEDNPKSFYHGGPL